MQLRVLTQVPTFKNFFKIYPKILNTFKIIL